MTTYMAHEKGKKTFGVQVFECSDALPCFSDFCVNLLANCS